MLYTFYVFIYFVFIFSIEQLFKNTDYLEVLSNPCVIIPGEKHEIEFAFYPRELKMYHETVGFELNGLSVVNIHISGQATEMKVRYWMSSFFVMKLAKCSSVNIPRRKF